MSSKVTNNTLPTIVAGGGWDSSKLNPRKKIKSLLNSGPILNAQYLHLSPLPSQSLSVPFLFSSEPITRRPF